MYYSGRRLIDAILDKAIGGEIIAFGGVVEGDHEIENFTMISPPIALSSIASIRRLPE